MLYTAFNGFNGMVPNSSSKRTSVQEWQMNHLLKKDYSFYDKGFLLCIVTFFDPVISRQQTARNVVKSTGVVVRSSFQWYTTKGFNSIQFHSHSFHFQQIDKQRYYRYCYRKYEHCMFTFILYNLISICVAYN